MVDVTKVRTKLFGDELVFASLESVEWVDQWGHRPVELEHLASAADPLRGSRPILGEHVGDLADIVLQRGDDGAVVVDDLVDDRVQGGCGAEPKEARAPLEARVARRATPVSPCRTVTMKPSPTKSWISPVPRRARRRTRAAEDDEQRVVVHLQLRPLMGVDRVLHRQLVQVELAAHRVELVRGGLEEARSRRALGVPASLVGPVEIDLPGQPLAVLVEAMSTITEPL